MLIMSTDLVYAADAWKSWSSLTQGERKLRAARAIQAGDHDDLWLMTLAYLQFKGRKGTSISAHPAGVPKGGGRLPYL